MTGAEIAAAASWNNDGRGPPSPAGTPLASSLSVSLSGSFRNDPKAPVGIGSPLSRESQSPGSPTAPGRFNEAQLPRSKASGGPPKLQTVPLDQEGHPVAKIVEKLDPRRVTEHRRVGVCPIDATKQSWGMVWGQVISKGQTGRIGLEGDLHGYYNDTSRSMSHDVPLLRRSHSRLALHQSTLLHQSALTAKRRAQEPTASADAGTLAGALAEAAAGPRVVV